MQKNYNSCILIVYSQWVVPRKALATHEKALKFQFHLQYCVVYFCLMFFVVFLSLLVIPRRTGNETVQYYGKQEEQCCKTKFKRYKNVALNNSSENIFFTRQSSFETIRLNLIVVLCFPNIGATSCQYFALFQPPCFDLSSR